VNVNAWFFLQWSMIIASSTPRVRTKLHFKIPGRARVASFPTTDVGVVLVAIVPLSFLKKVVPQG